MRCYTVRAFAFVEEGISYRPQIELGETGRGRSRAIVVMSGFPSVSGDEPVRINRARVGMTQTGPVILPPMDPDEDQRLLVLFKGSGGYSRGADYRVPRPEGAVLAALGHGAWGDAGRLGTWEEGLIILPPKGEAEISSKYARRVLRWDPERGLRALLKEEAAAEDAAAAAAQGTIQIL